MRRFLLGLLLFLPASAGRADDVRLQNGKTFEGVIAVDRGTVVEVQIPGGSLSLPKSSVREIVRSESKYAEYLTRAARLRDGDADARSWLLLARWARERDMETAAREAALEAAARDPLLPELAPVMRGFGYEYDEATQRWLPLAEVMHSRGMVLADGQWMTKAEAADLYRTQEAEARDARHQRDIESLERAAAQMNLAAAEMAASQANSAYDYGYGGAGPYDYWGSYGWPVAWYPGFFPNRPGFPDHRPPHGPRPTPFVANPHPGTVKLNAATRQPGSLFPVRGLSSHPTRHR